jgi:starch synthase (maltosyl-transferring)
MLPIGYEFGFQKQVNVVHTLPSDWERRTWDLRAFITRVNRLKLNTPLLHGEGALRAVHRLHGDTLLLERRGRPGEPGQGERGWIAINKVWDEPRTLALPAEARSGAYRLLRVCRDDVPEGGEAVPAEVALTPAEVVYVLPG